MNARKLLYCIASKLLHGQHVEVLQRATFITFKRHQREREREGGSKKYQGGRVEEGFNEALHNRFEHDGLRG